MCSMLAEFEFLCNSHQACPKVKEELRRMGFKQVKDTTRYSPFDIYARMRVKSVVHRNEVVEEIRGKFQGKIHTIRVTTW